VKDLAPPILTVTKARVAHVGSSGRVRIRVSCAEQCSIAIVARPDIAGVPALKAKVNSDPGKSRSVIVRFRGKRLSALRAQLRRRGAVKLYFSVVATDVSGNHTKPRLFTIKLSR
jgi:hypothetical protein